MTTEDERTRAAATPDPAAGSPDPSAGLPDRYRVVREIGRGGMGVVYEARDEKLQRTVAVKVLSAREIDEPTRRRFLREARAAAALNHPNIVAVYDAGESNGVPYLVMEHVRGRSLREDPPDSLDEAIDVARQVCDALEHAHARGVVHRDLKPGNVLVRRDGGRTDIKLTDMGIALIRDTARMTRTGAISGTPHYMAPEQALGRDVDGRADLYALGVMLYAWAAGRLPFEGTDALAVVSQHIHVPAVSPRRHRPDLSAELEAIVLRLLAKDPDARFAGAAELRSALAAVDAPPTVAVVPPEPHAPATPGGSPAAVDSLAVMPFVNESAGSEADYLSDGLTDSLIDSLSHLPRLRVMARSTVFRYKDREIDPQRIGAELGVRAVLTGRLVQRRDALVIRTELVDAADGTRLWGERFDRPAADLMTVEEEISQEICSHLRVELSGTDRERLARRATESPEAHQLYLKGRHVWSRWKTPEGMKTAIGFFERALELDPLYARAFAGLADSYSVLGNVKALPPGEAYPKAKTAAMQGLAVDDGLAELHTSLGFIQRMWEWNWEAAEASYRRAIELNPGYATAHRWYGGLLSGLARPDEAIPVSRRALELDPLSLIIHTAVGDVLFYARRYDEAIALYRATLEVDPDFLPGHTDLARALELAGRYDEAIEEFQRAAALVPKGPPEPSSGLAHVYARMGRHDEARAIVAQLLELSRTRYVSPYGIASIHACLGDTAAALDWLERAYDEHDQTLVWVKVHPRLDGLRQEPRFLRLLERMRLR
jgi:serine/threonine-protein kinase